MHAFYDHTRARRGHGKAIVATARKLAILFWCMLTRGEDYAHQQPSLTTRKLRRLELTAGAPKYAVWRDPDSNRGHHDFQASEPNHRTAVEIPANGRLPRDGTARIGRK
jgi:hypothetical protein